MNYFVMSDIHGHIQKMDYLLRKWNPDNEQLVFLGDYIDRGPESLNVLRRVKELTFSYGAVALMGNHEYMFLQWLKNSREDANTYVERIALTTILSFLSDVPSEKINQSSGELSERKIKEIIKEHHGEIIYFTKKLLPYYETEKYLFVHAGINPSQTNLENNTLDDLLWIREGFYSSKQPLDKIVIFGHTNTSVLHENESNTGVWIGESKVGIDGGVSSGKNLNAVVLDESGDITPKSVYQI